MRRSIIGYIKDNKVNEVIATADELFLEQFIDAISEHNFNEGYEKIPENNPIVSNGSMIEKLVVVEDNKPDYDGSIKSSKDLVKELQIIANQDIINFSEIYKLLESKSPMNNPNTKKILKTFLDIYDFSSNFEYDLNKFSEIEKAIFTFGSDKEKKDFNTFSNSLDANTNYLKILGYKDLVYSSIDKENYK